jgi:hypothetical protein
LAVVRRAAPAAMTASRAIRTRGQMARARRGAACDRRAWRAAP